MIFTFRQELQKLKPWDEVQSLFYPDHYKGYPKIQTAGHGYLVVMLNDLHADKAKEICKYGFVGTKAYYLEEDSEAREFLESF